MGASLQSGGSSGGDSRRSRRHNGRGFSEINVTPMVDVMLVLLIIFMVAAPMLTAGVAVDLPETSASPLPGKDEPLIVTLRSDGSIYIQESKVDVAQLGAKLKAINGAKTDTRIFIRADRRLDYGKVMAAVGEIDAAGFNRVAFVTESGQAK